MHCSTRHIAALGVFGSLVVIYTIISTSERDPTSVFFNPQKGYAPQYSTIRHQQAEAFISSYNATLQTNAVESRKGNHTLCVGIPSIDREGAQYLRNTVGSLLEGLSSQERSEIYLLVFIAHSNPIVHQAFGEDWLFELTDNILTYELADNTMQKVREMEVAGGLFARKGLFDYSYLLTKCAQQSIPYIAIFEDDTLAMDGWYHRTISAIGVAEQQAALKYAKPDFLYLRLFYTEIFLGWNSEEWRTYLLHSLCVAAVPTAILLFLHATSPTTKRFMALKNCHTLFAMYCLLATLILLLFALGRLTVFPIPIGVNEMSEFGCCGQAFVFPSH
jgi:hypothetical protein